MSVAWIVCEFLLLHCHFHCNWIFSGTNISFCDRSLQEGMPRPLWWKGLVTPTNSHQFTRFHNNSQKFTPIHNNSNAYFILLEWIFFLRKRTTTRKRGKSSSLIFSSPFFLYFLFKLHNFLSFIKILSIIWKILVFLSQFAVLSWKILENPGIWLRIEGLSLAEISPPFWFDWISSSFILRINFHFLSQVFLFLNRFFFAWSASFFSGFFSSPYFSGGFSLFHQFVFLWSPFRFSTYLLLLLSFHCIFNQFSMFFLSL